jgi:adenylate kinase family enzyme
MDSRLIIVRGLPGSGKSTLARSIARELGYLHFENDHYFEGADGYRYDFAKLRQLWCIRKTSEALLVPSAKVVVSNVFHRRKHLKDFLAMTSSVTVVECAGQYGSVHNVPQAHLDVFRDEWQPYAGAVVLN